MFQESPSGFRQSGVCVPVVKSCPPPEWGVCVGVLESAEQLRDKCQIVLCVLQEDEESCDSTLLLINCWLEAAHTNTRKASEMKTFFFPFYKQYMEGLLYPGGPHKLLLSFNPPFSFMLFNLEGNRGRTRKGIWLGREVQHKLSKDPTF